MSPTVYRHSFISHNGRAATKLNSETGENGFQIHFPNHSPVLKLLWSTGGGKWGREAKNLNSKMPFCYSYDVRGSFGIRPSHWTDDKIKSRALYRASTEPSTLSVVNVSENDDGEYRCRIDYLKSPTKNLRVRLTVIGK